MVSQIEHRPFESCIRKVKYTNKIASQDFKESGHYPIISQEESFISGYWDDANDVFHTTGPVVVFGDHTRHVKYVDFDFVIGADGVKIFDPVEDISAKYLYFFLRWLKIPSLGYSRHYKILKEKTVPIPKPEAQQRIVDELDLLSGIIEMKKEQLKTLDKLTESLFYEMFGVPTESTDDKYPIGNYANCIAGATPSTLVKSYWENGIIPWLSSGEVAKGRISETEMKITREGYDACSTRLVPKDTVLVAMAGQGKTRGTVGITNIELCTNQSICSIVINKDSLLPTFLYYQLKYLYNELRSISNGDGGRGGLNLKLISQFKVLVPQKEKQSSFVKKAEYIEKEKLLIQESTKPLEQLFAKRMDKYFSE